MKCIRPLLWSVIVGVFLVSTAGVPVSASTETVKNIILIISDGMHLQHEIAYSRYRYGTDRGLAFHRYPVKLPCATWDVTTYDRYAWSLSQPRYNPLSFVPVLGFDPAVDGSEDGETAVVAFAGWRAHLSSEARLGARWPATMPGATSCPGRKRSVLPAIALKMRWAPAAKACRSSGSLE